MCLRSLGSCCLHECLLVGVCRVVNLGCRGSCLPYGFAHIRRDLFEGGHCFDNRFRGGQGLALVSHSILQRVTQLGYFLLQRLLYAFPQLLRERFQYRVKLI
jgi:hypothetical protein